MIVIQIYSDILVQSNLPKADNLGQEKKYPLKRGVRLWEVKNVMPVCM